jgi:hypothetical protein
LAGPLAAAWAFVDRFSPDILRALHMLRIGPATVGAQVGQGSGMVSFSIGRGEQPATPVAVRAPQGMKVRPRSRTGEHSRSMSCSSCLSLLSA